MAESVSFRITTYRKLGRGETGITQAGSRRIALSAVLDWILSELPDEAVSISHSSESEAYPRSGPARDVVSIAIDWNKVPDSVRHPRIPRRYR